VRWVTASPTRRRGLLLGALPLLVLVLAYVIAAAARNADNPADKILPLPGAMAAAMAGLLFDPDPLSGQYLFWADTLASLWRLGAGLGIATATALLASLTSGLAEPAGVAGAAELVAAASGRGARRAVGRAGGAAARCRLERQHR
jgi:NitT/TauT family transport system permease protein